MTPEQRANFEEWWCGHGQYIEPWTCRDVAEAAWRACCCCHANAIDQPADDERERLRWIQPDAIEEQGFYWWWNGDEDAAPIPVSVMLSGTCGEYFASVGQYGWTEPQFVTDMGGWWMKLVEPSTAALGTREERA